MGAWVVLRDPLRKLSQPIPLWRNLRADKGKHGEGTATVSFPVQTDQGLQPEFLGLGQQFGWSADIYFWRNTPFGWTKASVPSWSGPVTGCTRRRDRDGVPWMDLRFETWQHHIWRRRLAIAIHHLPYLDYTGGIYYSKMAYDVASQALLSTVPYPGRQTAYPTVRADYLFWSVVTGTPVNIGPQTYIPSQESGSSAWDHLYSLLEVAGLAMVMKEDTVFNASPWNTTIPRFTFDFTYPYTRLDLSGSRVFSDLTGMLVGYEDDTDWAPLANAYIQRGKGQSTTTDAPYAVWQPNTASIGEFGVFEDGDTSWADANLASLSSRATLEAARRGAPKQTWKIALDKSPMGLVLGADIDVRDKVTVHDSVLLPEGVEQVISGWSSSCDNPGEEPTIELTVGDVPESWEKRVFDYVGTTGGKLGGGVARRKGG